MVADTSINVAYFSNQFAAANGHGIAHYAHRVYEGLKAEHADINIIPVATWSNRASEDKQRLQDDTGLLLLPWGRKLTPLSWTFWNSPSIESWLNESIDITHIVSLGFPVATKKKLVVTVHDIGPLTHPEYFYDNPWLFKRSFDHMVKYADAVICVSQATADEVIGYAGAGLADRIHVVHEGVDISCYENDPIDIYGAGMEDMPPEDVPFFMAAGAISPRKNITRALEAFATIKDSIPHHFVLAGGKGWKEGDVAGLISKLGLTERVHLLGYRSDVQLQALYKAASFYLHVSLFEGFGLTVLEAMAAGCPVITSNISSLPEVAGDAALLVDPLSVEEIAGAIECFSLNGEQRKEYTRKGRSRVGEFSWSDTANKVAGVYRGLV